ncbi:aquaporin [Violaceomyces palustris]|uniref:Aquaporin n=1 Tax=Violaceomyces palustris TaxID=1673888 RepID=A0ACD0P2H3_9BASI|nr:aquaporin [Violaceomyces palustris]
MSETTNQFHGFSKAEDVAIETSLDGATTPNSVTGIRLQLPHTPARLSHESDSAPHHFQLVPVQPHELVTGQVVKDEKTGRHYKKIPVAKPAYSLGHTKGAPSTQTSGPRTTGRIGLGHALPTVEQNELYQAEKRSNKGSSTESFTGAGGYSRSSMDANTKEGRALLLQQLRELIHEEVSKANQGHAADIKKHVENVTQGTQQQLEEMLVSETGKRQTIDSDGDSDEKRDELYTENRVETVDPVVAERGLEDCNGDDGGDDDKLEFPNPWAAFRYKMREPFAEFLGSFILMTFGDGINNQVLVSGLIDPATAKGNYLSISFGWGIAVAMGVYVAGGVSGGMLNPAVTITLATFRKFPWRKVPIYIAAQLLGSFMGALCIYGLYINPIRMVDPEQTERTAAFFTTFPAEFLRTPATRMSSFYNEIYASAVLLIVILAIGDSSNTPPPDGMAPIVLLWLIVGIGATLGWQTAYAVNPSRDLGPRIMLWMVGYSPDILWTFDAWYWLWTPTLATITGALLGALIYDTLIYTGGESPINRTWKWSDVRLLPSSKSKSPSGQGEP